MNTFQYGEAPSTPRGESRKTSTQHEKPGNPANRCKTCNRRIRGESHEAGAHHNNRVYKK